MLASRLLYAFSSARESVLQDEVADAGHERSEQRIRVQRRRGASELRLAGLDGSARGESGGASGRDGDGGVAGWVDDGGVRRRRDGGRLVGDAAGGRAGQRDRVDAIDGRRHVDGGVVGGVRRLGEGTREERGEEEDDDLLERTHLVGSGGVWW
ncbi:hypothetical protein N0V83_001637 [Neocucurbitaria cava]|uniref:Uncharacterized protein n=1 Tax=Neocucurbitaria cava TaxID=798079 RepID=A0A9W8YGF3_9PLEO|nr:hypothetical protein N0V83_001637 [Neocucurbitaria cava]